MIPAATEWANAQIEHLASVMRLRQATARARTERVLTPNEANRLDGAIETLREALGASPGSPPTMRGTR